MENLPVQTKTLRAEEDIFDYVECFNSEDLAGYTAYYSKDIIVNISALQDKTLKGYIEFLGPLHSQVSETLKLQKFAFDKYGKYIAADFHTEFRSKGEFETDQFAGQWGPMYADKGPLVRMLVWLHLSPEGYVIQLDSEAILIETAPSRPSA